MPSLTHLATLTAVVVFLGGCCRDTVREMASLKDMAPRASAQRAAAKPAPEKTTQSAKVTREDDGGAAAIETGSIKKPTCQGQHLAYQATKEYLKNFGPRPPDQPGERGPCDPNAQ